MTNHAIDSRKKVLILCDHFYPAWKLGGMIQSLKNLAFTLQEKMEVYVLTSAYDAGDQLPLPGIDIQKWMTVDGIQVRYLSKQQIKYGIIKNLVLEINPASIYINGMYSLPFAVYPLLMGKKVLKGKSKIVLSPRGMLQQGALQSKSLKKRSFLHSIQLMGLYKNICWHATDTQEAADIKKLFGSTATVSVVKDTPGAPGVQFSTIAKHPGELKLVYLSLIAAKKNLLAAIEWLKELNLPVTFDIYGPVKDISYWEKCKTLIGTLPAQVAVNYKGEVKPQDVSSVFSQYHAMLLPTLGENFGHVIYECFGAGRPVITSNLTPWKNLQEKNAGFDFPLKDVPAFKNAITQLYKMNQEEFNTYCKGAHATALAYWEANDVLTAYQELFS